MIRRMPTRRPAAKVVIAVAAAALVSGGAAAARGQTNSGLLLEPLQDEILIEADASGTFLDKGSTGEGSISIDYYEVNGRVRPLLRDFRAKPRFGYDLTLIDVSTTDPRLPDAQLVDTSVGFGMGIFQGGEGSGPLRDAIAGITLGVGYAGVGAFDDGNAYYGLATLAVGRVFDNGDAFGLVVDYDGNRTFLPDWPLPGFQYQKNLPGPLPGRDTLKLNIGFPFTGVIWGPTDRLTVTANYAIPDEFTGRIDYELLQNTGVFAEVAARREAFHWDELDDGGDRLLFRQRRVEAGVRYTLNDNLDQAGVEPGLTAVLAGGYAFGQEFEVGFDSRDTDGLADPSDEPYVRVGLELRY